MAEVDYGTLKKGGFMRQKQKNHFSLRLGVVGGTVTAEQLAAVTEVAKKYGHGYIHLTSRQGIEIPYIKLEDIDAVKEALATGNIAPGVCGPRVRTVTACQGDTVCPNSCVDTQAIAKELSERYFGKELPHKFKFGVTGCQNNCLKAEENDLGIKGGLRIEWKPDTCIRCGLCEKICRLGAIKIEDGKVLIDQDKCNYCGRCFYSCSTDSFLGTKGYIVRFGGLFGNRISQGEVIIPFIEDKEKLFVICDVTLKFFEENAKPGERFKYTLERVGFEKFREAVLEAYEG